jgi:hypothetical protein
MRPTSRMFGADILSTTRVAQPGVVVDYFQLLSATAPQHHVWPARQSHSGCAWLRFRDPVSLIGIDKFRTIFHVHWLRSVGGGWAQFGTGVPNWSCPARVREGPPARAPTPRESFWGIDTAVRATSHASTGRWAFKTGPHTDSRGPGTSPIWHEARSLEKALEKQS